MVDCTRSELAVRLWSCKCSESSLTAQEIAEGWTRRCSPCLVFSWFLTASVLLLICSFLTAFDSSVSIFCVLPQLGSTAGNRTSLPVSRQVNCYLILRISSCEQDTIKGTELLNWLCVPHLQEYPYQCYKHWHCTICRPGMKQTPMVADPTVS